MADDAGVRIRLLGGFEVTVGDRPVAADAWRLRKAKTLVKLLALARGHRLHREALVAVLWPDRDGASATNNLHQALYIARRALAGTSGVLSLRDDVVLLSAGAMPWLDKLPLAPLSERVDLVAPPFSNPTNVTNPLFPVSNLHSAILNGKVDGKPFKVETTLLPETRIIEWIDGQCVETLVSQYVAYLNGRIEEVALDLYAQADDGSVWYFGEDVFNYSGGVVEDLEGTWLAGREGPAAMIMPADPKVGNAYLPENIPGFVFEEVTVKAVDQTVAGPHGPVDGAMVSEELHQDGSFEEKIFAPEYGEFFTGSGDDVEALALAVPTDMLAGSVPDDLKALSNGADRIFAAVKSKNWKAASAATDEMRAAWKAYKGSGEAAARLRAPMQRAIKGLTRATGSRDAIKSRRAALAVADAALDLQLQYRPPIEVDIARFDLWVRRVVMDAAAGDSADILGDVAVLEWIRDRIAHGLDDVTRTRLDVQLLELRHNANDEDSPAAANTARALRTIIAGL